jgi:HK97 family phage major capsid protein
MFAPEGSVKTVSVESTMSAIENTVAGLTNDQLAAIESTLSVAFDGVDEEEEDLEADDELVDEVVDEVLMDLEEDDEEEMADDEEDYDELMARLMEDDEEYEEEMADDEEDEELMAFLMEDDEDEELEAYFADEEEEEEEMEATIRAAVNRALRQRGMGRKTRRRNGRNQSRRRNRKAFTAGRRPPYTFAQGRASRKVNAVKTLNRIRYGRVSEEIKTIAADLYGNEYEELRFEQHAAYGKFCRRGKDSLSDNERSSLKTIVLTPTQLTYLAAKGVSISSVKTDMSEILLDLGGFLVPEDLRTDIIERLPGLTVVRSRADVGPTGSDVMTRVKVTGGDDRYVSPVRTTWVGDAPTASARTAPTFGIERTPVNIQKATVYVPMTLLEDTPFPLTTWINDHVTKAYAMDEDDAFLVGDGNAKPEGILPSQSNLVLGSGQEVVSGNASALTADGVIDLVYALAEQYWAGAVFIMNRSTAGIVRKFKDGEGNYLWEPSYQAGQPPTLLGYPVAMSEAMADVAANSYPMLFGDLNQGYQIADRIGMSVIRDDVTLAESDMIKFIFRRRVGAQVKGEWSIVTQKVST